MDIGSVLSEKCSNFSAKTTVHGINGKTPEETMRNIGLIASPGMVGTEKTIFESNMKEKKNIF